MATTTNVNFSELLRNSAAIIARLFSGGLAGLRLTRRDGDDLYLTTAKRAEQVSEVVRSNVLMLRHLLNDPEVPRTRLENALADAHPWVGFLPEPAIQEFLGELIETSRASLDIDAVGAVYQVIVEWKHTAEIYAEPDLYKRLASVSHGDDHGRVPMPEVTKR